MKTPKPMGLNQFAALTATLDRLISKESQVELSANDDRTECIARGRVEAYQNVKSIIANLDAAVPE